MTLLIDIYGLTRPVDNMTVSVKNAKTIETAVAILAIFRGPFITAMGKTWCPGCFLCSMDKCQRSLQDVGFVEEKSEIFST